MQQLTFISALDDIAETLIVRKSLLKTAKANEENVLKVDTAFKAVHAILKSFYKKDGKGYSDVEMNEKLLDTHSRYAQARSKEDDNWLKETLEVNSDLINFQINKFSGREYVMSNNGVKFSFTSKSFKGNLSKIKAAIA